MIGVKTIKEISKLPKRVITLDTSAEGKNIFKSFTKPHPRLLVVKNKSLGVALIDLKEFKSEEDYLKSVSGKNSTAYFSRKAARKGYTFKDLDPHKHDEEILSINGSASERQGKGMDDSYRKKIDYPVNKRNLYFGIYQEKTLVAYIWVVLTGELAILNRLLGHAEHLDAGIMYQMVSGVIGQLIKDHHEIKYVMYDTMMGAGDGLKLFKKRCGFKAYRVNWKQE